MRFKRGLAGAFALSLGLALGLAACQDGYPIPATLCDRWCKVTKGTECDSTSPTGCVAGCEETLVAACVDEFEAEVRCLETENSKIFCGGVAVWMNGTIPECQSEQTELLECSKAHLSPRRGSEE